MTIAEVINALEKMAAPSLQEPYDNSGLIVGEKSNECTGILISLDTTEGIISEAIHKKCNLVVSHHPIVFKGLKGFTGKTYIERTIIQAIKNDIAIYAIHTNLDNVNTGVNARLAERLGLQNCTVLEPKPATVMKLVTFVPMDHLEKVRVALFSAGAGDISNYSECSFGVEGTGTFKAMEGTAPFVGKVGERHNEKETRIEVIFPVFRKDEIVKNLLQAHPYEEVAYYISSLENRVDIFGSGMIGELPNELSETAFLSNAKSVLGADVLRHTALTGNRIKKIAVCGGAGFFLLNRAKAAGVDVYITADIKYHEFFDADGDLLLVDAGHYETEQFTIELLADYLQKYFPNFAVQKTEVLTNPVRYYI